MSDMLIFILSVFGLIGILVLAMEVGRRLGVRGRAQRPDVSDAGLGTLDAAVYGLLALMISFTFAGAANRFDARRQLVLQEANAIHTAYLRVGLLPSDMRESVRQDFRDYVDERLRFYQYFATDDAKKDAADRNAKKLQEKIWNESVDGAHATGSPAAVTLILSSLNEMIDITTTRQMATNMHPPVAIYLALGVLAFTGVLLAGYGTASSKQRSWLHIFIFCGVLGLAVYTILDLEYPRVGLIRVDATDHLLMEERSRM